MKMFLYSIFAIIFMTIIVTGGSDKLCMSCTCSTVNIIFSEAKFSCWNAVNDLTENESRNWSPIFSVIDPRGMYLEVNCSNGRIASQWPPIEPIGIIGHFDKNGLESLPDFPSVVKRKMVKLSFNQNRISQILSADLVDYLDLMTLNLNSNRIQRIDDFCFSAVRRLLKLDLSNNIIEHFGKWSMESDLNYLDLSHNKISSFDHHSFHGLKKLFFLDVSNNRLTNLPGDFASSLPRLKFLYLVNNMFENIPRLPKLLCFLNVSSNALNAAILPQIDELLVLDVSNNQLDDIDNVYEQLSLKVLKANHNHLSKIEKFKTSELKVLDLAYNIFNKIPEEISATIFPHLQELYLDGNPLNDLRISNEDGKPFPNLSKLGLSNLGNLTKVSEESFTGLIIESYVNCSEEKGVAVDLSRNKLKAISASTFKRFPVCSIDLGLNNLTMIHEELFHWQNLLNANLQDNPWNCVCDLQWMLDKYLPHFYMVQPRSLFNLRCATPARFRDKLMVYWLKSETKAFCKGLPVYQYEYSEGKYFEVWTASAIASIVLLALIIALMVIIAILFIIKPNRIKGLRKFESKRRSKPLFSDLRISPDYRYNEISQNQSKN